MFAEPYQILPTLAHELRQPLSTIESIAFYLELALPHAEPRVKAQLERLRDAIAQSDGILRDALALAQLGEPRPAAVDLNEIIEEFAAPHFSLQLAAQPVHMDLLHARKLVETICSLFAHHSPASQPNTLLTEQLPSGRAALVLEAAAFPQEGSTLSWRCLDSLAKANGVSLEHRHLASGRQQLRLEFPPAGFAGEQALPPNAFATPSTLASSVAAG
jgi:signal transduction histidine kinase